jgi:3-deoxy-D-manno-octulosonic-acid transferase
MYWLYSALLCLAMVATLPYWLWQMVQKGKYRAGLRQRLGKVPSRLAAQQRSPCIWVHAVSVGEVIAVTPLVENLKQQFPGNRVVISTVTDTGQKLARSRFGEDVFYLPLDFEFAIRPYLKRLQPKLVIIAETELWPNFLRLARNSGARIAVVNARISDRSIRGYLRVRPLLRNVLSNVDLFLTQTWEDRKRLVEIGAADEKVKVTGNLKFDAALSKMFVPACRGR